MWCSRGQGRKFTLQTELTYWRCQKLQKPEPITGGRPQREADHSQGMVKGKRDDSQTLRDKNWHWVTMAEDLSSVYEA